MKGVDSFDYVSIGSGLGGLLLSALLASKGKKVCVIEQHYEVGGYAQSFHRQGYAFSAGLHYVFNCLKNEDGGYFLRKLKLDKKITFSKMDPKGFDILHFPAKVYKVQKGVMKNIKALKKLFPDHEQSLKKYYEVIQRIYNEAFQLPLDFSLGVLLKNPLKFRHLIQYRNKTTQEVFNELKFPIELQGVLSGQAGNFALGPEDSSFIVQALNVMVYDQGACFPTKSYYHLIQTIANYIKSKKGCEVRLTTKVSKLKEKDGKIECAVLDDKKSIVAKNFLFNADPHSLIKMVGSSKISNDFKKKLIYPYSAGSFTLYMGLKNVNLKKHGFGNSNHWHFFSYDMNKIYRDQVGKGNLDKPFLAITTPTLHGTAAKHIAPKGKHQMVICTWCGYDSWKKLKSLNKEKYKTEKDRITNVILDIIDKEYIPNFRKYIDVIEVGTPTTNEFFANAPRGNTYGANLTPKQVNTGKLNYKSPFSNLFFINATSTMPGLGGAFRGSLDLFSRLTDDKKTWDYLYGRTRIKNPEV